MVGRNIREHQSYGLHQFVTKSSDEVDLRDYAAVYRMLADELPDMVIHAAGRVGGIQANISDPVGYLNDNLTMGMNLINSCNLIGIPNFLNLGSSCMYPKNYMEPLREEQILTGSLEPTNEGYALAKIVSAKLCEYITGEDRGRKYRTIIPCNLYGRHDKFDPQKSHMIAAVIRKLHEAKSGNVHSVDIWGDGSARREFMSATDLADFIFYALEKFEQLPQNLNVGLGFDFTIKEYYEAIADATGYTGAFQYDHTKPVGMERKLIDDSKLLAFGWKHQLTLKDGLEEAYAFFKHGT